MWSRRSYFDQARPPGSAPGMYIHTASGGSVGGPGIPGLFILVSLNLYRARLKVVMKRVKSSHIQSVVRPVQAHGNSRERHKVCSHVTRAWRL